MAYIDNFKTSSAPSASSNDDDARKIFVGGLSWGTTEDGLKEYFSRFGPILDCVLKVDNASGRSRGFGFVLFKDTSTVDEVLSPSVSHVLQGRTITPRKARKGREPVLKVFVGGVDPAVPERDIWDHFGTYGKVVDLDLPYDRNKGCRRAFCFVTFETEEAVNAVCKDEKQKLGDKYVDVKRATPKNARNDQAGGVFYSRGGYNGGGVYGNRGGGVSGGGYNSSVSYNNDSASGYGGGYGNSYGSNGGYQQSYTYGGGGNGSYGGVTSGYGGGGGGYGSGNSTYAGGNGGSYGYGGGGGGVGSYGSRVGVPRGSASGGRQGGGVGGYGGTSRGYSSGGFSQGSNEWGRQQSGGQGYGGGASSYGYYKNNYNNNYDGYD